MKLNPKRKKWLIAAIALVLVAAIGFGIWAGSARDGGEAVGVFPFHYLGMTEYWGDSQESYGPVRTDNIQTVYLTDTQTVTEILVSAGDSVKKGDLLMTFDTTLSDLALERKRLDVEKLKLQLEDAKAELRRINGMKPMVIPQPSDDDTTDENLGTSLTSAYQISSQTKFDGSSKELALICWLNTATSVDQSILAALQAVASEYQTENARDAAENSNSSASASFKSNTSTENPTDVPTEKPTEKPTEAPTEKPTEKPTEAPTEKPTEKPTEAPTEKPTEKPTEAPTEKPTEAPTEAPDEPTEAPTEEPTEPEITVDANRFYVVFKTTQGNMSLGQKLTWQGIFVIRNPQNNTYSFQFFNASGVSDHMLSEEEAKDTETPQIDFGSGFTAGQIAEMRSQQEKTIRDLEFNVKMAEADYKIMLTEANDGNVYATIDGQVVSVLSEEEAKMMVQPILKVSGGGGFNIQGSVSELEKDNLQIGQEVTINDWNTGAQYTGTIASVGDFPSLDGYWNGMGNPNASYYPFTVFVDGSADLQEGRYVNMTYSTSSGENGIYLENPFLRTEKGRSYVYVRGADGLLEKRYVTTGKSLWGSYTEILDGLTPEDYIAFPYGKNVKPGAQTVESDLSSLYG